MSPFLDPEIKRKGTILPLADCSICQKCVIPVNTIELEFSFRAAMFCIKEKRYLIKYFHHGRYITGIENAKTCPNFKKT
ncbi:MAG: hypothetical protein GXO88_07830 [Chlorobi bacterium]|nr:hypothetical protein [Chlorobiota bacterium]